MTEITAYRETNSTSTSPETLVLRPGGKASEKRKAQNRAAQKTYREKRKRRLHELEKIAVNAGLINSNSSSSSNSGDSPPDISQESQQTSASNLRIPNIELLNSATLNTDDLFANEPFLTQSLDMSPSNSWDTNLLTPAEDPIWTAAAQGLSSFIDVPDQIPFSGSQHRARSFTDNNTSTDLTSVELFRAKIPQDRHELRVMLSQLDPMPRPTHADPYSNTLRLHQTTVCWAFYQNVLHLGLDETLCAENCVSPFYRPGVIGNDALVKSVQSTFSCLKRDLRPTKEQVSIKHAAYVDVMPFPEVRTRIIELVAHDPPLFDEDEFWADIESGGLTCWGSIAVRAGGPSIAGGAPWDARSWEAKTWFLAKWSFIVGDEDGELSRSSAWWREMRGAGQGFSW